MLQKGKAQCADACASPRPNSTAASRTALVLILVSAAALRVAAIGLGSSSISFQPDERFNNLEIPLHLSRFDPNPHRFYYPALLWYVLAFVERLAIHVGHLLHLVPMTDLPRLFELDPIVFFWLGRSVVAAFGVATVALVYELGRRLYSDPHGLLAAGFLAVALLHVRDSALVTVDVPMTFFIVAALVGAAAIAKGASHRHYLFAGAAAGLAVATKYNAAVVFIVIVTAHIFASWEEGRSPWRAMVDARLAWAAIALVAAFAAVNSYFFLDGSDAWADLRWEWSYESTRHYVNVGPSWWYHLKFSLRYGMGIVAFALGGLGVARALIRRDRGDLVILSFAIAYFVLMALPRMAFARYMVPLLPVLCLFAATAVFSLADRFAEPWRILAVAAFAVAAIAEPLLASLAYARLVHRTDTRVELYRYVERNLPAKVTLATYGPTVVWKSTIPSVHPHLIHVSPATGETWASTLKRVKKTYRVEYFLVHESPLSAFSFVSPELAQALRESATLVAEFPYYRSRDGVPNPVYEQPDGFFFPLSNFRGVNHPGPTVQLYHLD